MSGIPLLIFALLPISIEGAKKLETLNNRPAIVEKDVKKPVRRYRMGEVFDYSTYQKKGGK